MSTTEGVAQGQNSLLLPAGSNKPSCEPADDKTSNSVAKSPGGTAEKTWYGWLRGWWHGHLKVIGCIDVIKTKKLRVNLHVKVYESGKWPWFDKKYLIDEYTIQIPASMIKDIHKEINEHYGARSQKLKKHTWTKKRYAR